MSIYSLLLIVFEFACEFTRQHTICKTCSKQFSATDTKEIRDLSVDISQMYRMGRVQH